MTITKIKPKTITNAVTRLKRAFQKHKNEFSIYQFTSILSKNNLFSLEFVLNHSNTLKKSSDFS